MFNKLKQIKNLRSQAKTLQNALSGESTTTDKHGIVVEMNGNMEITKLNLDAANRERLSSDLIDTVNEAIKKTQKLMGKKMQEMGGLGDLSNLLKQ